VRLLVKRKKQPMSERPMPDNMIDLRSYNRDDTYTVTVSADAEQTPAPAAAPVPVPENPANPETPVKQKKKRRILPVCIAAVLVLALAAYGTTYAVARTQAKRGNFATADRLLFLKPLTSVHDGKLVDFVSAGKDLETRSYASAIDGFGELGSYLGADEMEKEAQYRYAAQLADNGEFDEAVSIYRALSEFKDSKELINETRFRQGVYSLYERGNFETAESIFKSLSNIGYSKASEMLKETYYLKALDRLEKGMEADAYELLDKIRGYENVDEYIDRLADVIYTEGQIEYRSGRLVKARKLFETVSPYLDSKKYLQLIEIANKPLVYDETEGRECVNTLLEMFYFENAADLLVSKDGIAGPFLEGTWKTSNEAYYLTVNAQRSSSNLFQTEIVSWQISYNLPSISYGDRYSIKNSIYYLHPQNDRDNNRACFEFFPLTPDSMEVYCYSDGSTYTLYRQ